MFGVSAVEFDNIIGDVGFFLLFSTVGLALSATFVATLFKILPGFWSNEKDTNYVATSLIFIGLTFLTAEAAAFVNYKYRSTPRCSDFVIESKSFGGNRAITYWLFIKINDKEERIELFKSTWDKYKQGGAINVCTAPGFLGFDVLAVNDH